MNEVAELINTAINKIWPDKTEAEKQQLAAAVMVVQGQIDTNKVEAANPSIFVSGWRPFVGWVCGAACAWNWGSFAARSTARTRSSRIGTGRPFGAAIPRRDANSMSNPCSLNVGKVGASAVRDTLIWPR